MNDTAFIDCSLIDYDFPPDVDTSELDNIRVYVPLDLSKVAILRRLNWLIARRGEASEKNESDYCFDVDMLLKQAEVYDQLWREPCATGSHSEKGICLAKEIISALESIPDAGAELFPFETIDELKKEYGL